MLARGDSWRGGALRPSHLAFSFAFLMQTKLPHAPCATLKPLRTTQDWCSTQRPHHRHMHVQWHLGALQNSTAQKWRHRPHVSAIAPPNVTSSSRMYHCLADATKAAVASEECASSSLTLTQVERKRRVQEGARERGKRQVRALRFVVDPRHKSGESERMHVCVSE